MLYLYKPTAQFVRSTPHTCQDATTTKPVAPRVQKIQMAEELADMNHDYGAEAKLQGRRVERSIIKNANTGAQVSAGCFTFVRCKREIDRGV